MIEKPERYLEAYAKAGAAHLTVHVETCPHLAGTLAQIKSFGCLAGVTLNPGTPVSALEAVLHLADLVLVMSVNPGFSYQTFMPDALGRIRQVRQMLDEIKSPAHLEVDGGISSENIAQIAAAGANAFVSANAVFRHPQGTATGLQTLRESLNKPVGVRGRPA
jgi:ribulose-phosphate 3-epimerase